MPVGLLCLSCLRRIPFSSCWIKSLHVSSTCPKNIYKNPDNRGKIRDGVNFDTLGSWDNRLELPILEEQSLRHGNLIPKITSQYAGMHSEKGRRLYQEDRSVCIDLQENVVLVGVFDGHNHASAADFLTFFLPGAIKFWLSRMKKLEDVLHRSLLETNNLFLRHVQRLYSVGKLNTDEAHSGSTATVCLLRNSVELVVANVGDSKAVLCREGKPLLLSYEHDPSLESEQQRIKARGGIVSTNSLGNPVVNGRLTMTRSIGDSSLKYYGVCSEPSVRSVGINHSKDGFLVLISDGITHVMANQEIVDVVCSCKNPQEASEILTDQALQFGSEDNSTAVILPFGSWGKHAKLSASTVQYSFGRNLLSRRFME